MATCSKNYGWFQPHQRFAMDQVPLELDNLEYTIESKGNKSVHVKGARTAQDQKRATMQVCLRVKGPQVVPLVLVLHNDNPGENRFQFPPGLAARKPVTFNGSSIAKPEQEWYDKSIVTMWDKRAWFSAPVAKDWYEWFLKKTEGVRKSVGKVPSIALQVDNLKQQIHPKLQHLLFDNGVFMQKIPPNCTDILALIDHNIGKYLKVKMSDYYWEEFSKNDDSIEYFSTLIKAHEWRIWYTRWAARAWRELCSEPKLIFKCAQSVGYANCICGCENDKIGVFWDGYEYVAPSREETKMEPLSKEEVEQHRLLHKRTKKEKIRRARRRRARAREEKKLQIALQRANSGQ